MGAYYSRHPLHYICTKCRIGSKSMNKTIKCPHCGIEMTSVSVCFRIPKKTDDKAWKMVKKELMHGNRFYSLWWAR